MRAKLICYELKANAVRRTMLHRELYGYKDISNHGRYNYKRQGLLQRIKGRRVTDGVLMIAEEQAKSVVLLLKKFGAKTYVFLVLTKA